MFKGNRTNISMGGSSRQPMERFFSPVPAEAPAPEALACEASAGEALAPEASAGGICLSRPWALLFVFACALLLAIGALAASPSAAWANTDGIDAPLDFHTTDELEWFPDNPSEFVDFHNDPSTLRVIDYANLLTDEQEAQLNAKIADMQERLGIDFVFYSDNSSYGEERGVFAADFYQMNGYGFGDDYSGVIYFVCMEEGNRGFWTAARGGARDLMTEENVNYMDDRTYSMFKNGDYGEAVLKQFDMLDTLYTHEGFPTSPGVYYFAVISGVIVGAIAGAVNLFRKRKKMATVRNAATARLYAASPHFSVKKDVLVNTTVNRTLHVSQESSGGGGGGSTYSGNYSSSGGASFSGGGRSF